MKLRLLVLLAVVFALTGCDLDALRARPSQTKLAVRIAQLEERVSQLEEETKKATEQLVQQAQELNDLRKIVVATVKEAVLKETVVIKQEVKKASVKVVGYFKFGRTKINKEFTNELQKIVECVKTSKEKVTIKIQGFTDSKGSAKFNKWFSEKRAEEVKEKIISMVGSADNIDFVIEGMGPSPDNQRKVIITCQ